MPDNEHQRTCRGAGQGQTFGSLIALAVWFGLVVGLAEAAIRTVQRLVLVQWTFLSPHVVWMAPLADASLYIIIAVMLFVAGRWWPSLGGQSAAVSTFVFLGALAPLWHLPGLHWATALLIAAGLAIQAARLARRFGGVLDFAVRRSTVALAAVVVLLGASLFAHDVIRERRAIAALPVARPGVPNVILIVLDTVRAPSLSLHGYARPTSPALDEFARRGIVFERAVSTSPWTLPAHATLFTGRYPHEVSATWLTSLDGRFPTLAEVFRDHGYVTAGFVANLTNTTYENGLGRGFVRFEDYPISVPMLIKSSWLWRLGVDPLMAMEEPRRTLVSKTAEDINRDVLRWLRAPRSRPFFVFINYFDAHAPYVTPGRGGRRFGADLPRPPQATLPNWTHAEIQIEVDAYDSAIAYLDHQLGVLLGELRRGGLLESTLVVITSDHGEQFGEHGLFEHANSLYRPALHVPLVIVLPQVVPAALRIAQPVTLRDVTATIADLVDLPAVFPGASLASHWTSVGPRTGPPSPILSEVHKGINLPSWLPVSRGDMRSLIDDGLHFIRNGDGTEELYDFVNDPAERMNLMASASGTREADRMRTRLQALDKATGPDPAKTQRAWRAMSGR